MPLFFNQVYFGNTVLDYLGFLLALVISFIAIKIIGHLLFKRLSLITDETKTENRDHFVKRIKENVLPSAYFGAFYLITKSLQLHPSISNAIETLLFAFVIVMVTIIASNIIIFFFGKYWESKEKDPRNILTSIWISRIIKAFVWGIALILFLENMGFKVNTLIAGLGIGGLAVAFAAQAIIADIFCFFTILFDRPFEIGDFIIVGNEMGTVEHIGLKTTRIRSLNGEQHLFSNTDLTNSRIRNFKTMEERRVLFALGVTYDTPSEKLKEIPAILRNIIENTPDTTFGRAHFVSYGPYSLNFEMAYYVLSADYDKYLDIHQEVNFNIKEEFEKRNIIIAFPTQTLHLQNDSVLSVSK